MSRINLLFRERLWGFVVCLPRCHVLFLY